MTARYQFYVSLMQQTQCSSERSLLCPLFSEEFDCLLVGGWDGGEGAPAHGPQVVGDAVVAEYIPTGEGEGGREGGRGGGREGGRERGREGGGEGGREREGEGGRGREREGGRERGGEGGRNY